MRRISIMPALLIACALASAAGAGTGRNDPAGTWTGELRSDRKELQLNLHSRGEQHSHWGNGVPLSELRGFTGEDGEAHFSLTREAGTAFFDGTFRGGEGAGHVRFETAAGYFDSMARLGYPDARKEKPLFLALLDVGPRRAREYQEVGFKHLSWDDFFAFSIHGVSAAWIREMRGLGLKMSDPEQVAAMRIHDVTPAFVREVRQAGLGGADEESLTQLRIHDVTPAYAREMRSIGLGPLDAEQLMQTRIHDVTPAYVQEMRSMGLGQLDLDRLLQMKIHDVTPEFVRRMRAEGFTKATADDLIRLRIHGVDQLLTKKKSK